VTPATVTWLWPLVIELVVVPPSVPVPAERERVKFVPALTDDWFPYGS